MQFPVFHDDRGQFVKTIQSSVFQEQGLEGDFRECFYTTSYKDVLRGMHFQTPPSDHAKLLYCTGGSIYDVALDLRNVISNLENDLTSGHPVDLRQRLTDIEQKIGTRLREGGLDTQTAASLTHIITAERS